MTTVVRCGHCGASERGMGHSIANCRTCGNRFCFKRSQLNHYRHAGSFCSSRCRREYALPCSVCKAPARTGGSVMRKNVLCREHRGQFYLLYSPLQRRAWSMGGQVVGWRGKRRRVEAMLSAAIGRPCRYCSVPLTLENASLDHKVSFGNAANRKNRALRLLLSRRRNLQIVCVRCNSMKSDLDHAEFSALLLFLKKWPLMKLKLFRRLRRAAGRFRQGERDAVA